MTCNLEVICPALSVFVAKDIRVEGFSFPGSCSNQKTQIKKNKIQRINQQYMNWKYPLTLNWANDAACASRAWLLCWSTEKSCMFPFTSCGLYIIGKRKSEHIHPRVVKESIFLHSTNKCKHDEPYKKQQFINHQEEAKPWHGPTS